MVFSNNLTYKVGCLVQSAGVFAWILPSCGAIQKCYAWKFVLNLLWRPHLYLLLQYCNWETSCRGQLLLQHSVLMAFGPTQRMHILLWWWVLVWILEYWMEHQYKSHTNSKLCWLLFSRRIPSLSKVQPWRLFKRTNQGIPITEDLMLFEVNW